MKTLVLSLALITVFLFNCKHTVAESKQKQINATSLIEIKKEAVIYPLRDPFDNDLCREYKRYLNRNNGGC